MPQKKSTGSHAKQPSEPPFLVTLEGGDPVATFISVVDKKARNLEKRRNKLTSLKDGTTEATLDKDQREAITKIKDVTIQIELVKEFQRQFSAIEVEYAKLRKRQQRVEKQQAKEAERVAKQQAITYTMRVTDMLISMEEEDKDNFRTGSEGAVKLSDGDLTLVDDLYKVINPQRGDNSAYESELCVASEHMLNLMEGSSKEVLGTTYKNLQEVMKTLDTSGYFDHIPRMQQVEDSDDDGEGYKSADDQMQPRLPVELIASEETGFTEEVDIPPEVPPANIEPEGPPEQLMIVPESVPIDPPLMESVILGNTPPIMTQTSGIMNYMPSAPSPTFPALGTSPVLLSHDDGFSFMHESELDRTRLHQSLVPAQAHQPHQPTPHSITTYAQYDTRGGAGVGVVSAGVPMDVMVGQSMTAPGVSQNSLTSPTRMNTTDVTTGQPNPQHSYPPSTAIAIDTTATTSTTAISSSSGGLINQELGVVGGVPDVGMALYSSVMPSSNENSSAGFNRPRQHPPTQNQLNGAPQNRGGRGFNQSGGGRRGGGGGWNKGNYTTGNKNGRGMQGGVDSQGQSYGSSRNYGDRGGGYTQQQQRGGRPNYRSANGAGGSASGGQRRS